MWTKLGLLSVLFALVSAISADQPSVPLGNAAVPGLRMPVAGIGTWGYGSPGETWSDAIALKAVSTWLKLGGRRIDGSLGYGDQVGVGQAVAESGLNRDDIFITSKVSPNGYNATMDQFAQILQSLNTSYVDLLLIHWPYGAYGKADPPCNPLTPAKADGCRQDTWRALEDLFKSGKTRSIGVSNFQIKHLESIMQQDGLVPAVNQVEFHPYWHEFDILNFCKAHNITFNSYSPLSCPDWAPETHGWAHSALEEPVVKAMAAKHSKSAAQVVQRWAWQQGVVLNPRTLNEEHMKENLDIFDFQLSDDEVKQISDVKAPGKPKVCPDTRNTP